VFTEETDGESTCSRVGIIGNFYFTRLNAGIFMLSRLHITRFEDAKEKLIHESRPCRLEVRGFAVYSAQGRLVSAWDSDS